MKVYEFVVYQQRYYNYAVEGVFVTQNSFVVRHDGPMDEAWFNYTATTLALALRFCLTWQREIHRIVAFEIVEGEEYNWNTITHVMLPNSGFADNAYPVAAGFKAYDSYDHHVGISVLHNREVGRVTRTLIRSAFNWTDVALSHRSKWPHTTLNLNMDGQFATQSFPYYRFLLEHLVGLKTDVEVERYGTMRELEKGVGRLMVGAAENHNKKRRAQRDASAEAVWMDNAIFRATLYSDKALNLYRECMERFDHRWGDGVRPEIGLSMEQAIYASSMWQWFAIALNYEHGESQSWPYPDETDGWLDEFPPPQGTVTLRARDEEVLRCVVVLYNSHQFLLANYRKAADSMYSGRPQDKYGRYMPLGDATYARELYDAFDAITAAIFMVSDALNAMQQIVEVANPKDKTRNNFAPPVGPFVPPMHPYSPPFSGIEVLPYFVSEPADKDPFLTTYSPAQATVVMQPEPIDPTSFTYVPPKPTPASAEDEIEEDAKAEIYERIDQCKTQRGRVKAYGERFDQIFGTPGALKRINET
jgi:hypothetical protein